MREYDAVVVGAATTGSWFAHALAARGHSVLLIDRADEEHIGTKYDIYHVSRRDLDRFGLPLPVKGEDWAFEFEEGENRSALDRFPKRSREHIVGMHMHPHVLRLNRWAAEAGAELVYGASFRGLEYDKNGKICGVRYEKDGETVAVHTKLAADCSGIPSAVRTALPEGYGVETFSIGPEDMFYVNLRYVRFHDPRDYIRGNCSWAYYKTWRAPQPDPAGAILGVGANFSHEYADQVYGHFTKAVKLPAHTVERIERGATPYRRPPYSMVADGFIAMGDAACLTKPTCGEGVASSLVQAEIAVDVVDELLRAGKPLSRANLWPINKRYVEVQGREFASQLAMFAEAAATSPAENDFLFAHDIVFNEKSLQAVAEGREVKLGPGEIARIGGCMALGTVTGRVRLKTIRRLLKALADGGRISSVYAHYPDSPEGFDAWVRRADRTWASCGSMAEAARAAEAELKNS